MVVGAKMTEERSGRRSRGPSPNNRVLTDESSDSDDSDSDGGMRVGRDYQAVIPYFNPDVKPEARAEAMLVWAPHPEMPPSKVVEYITVAKERHGYNMEQSLGMLFWHKHHVERALTDLANFTPFPDEWTVEDKVLFEQAFSFHGKSFHRIRQMLPDKSIAQLVKYYYSWKKTRSRTSLMDRQARKIVTKDESDDDTGNESDLDPKESSKEDSKNSSNRPGPASKKLELHPRNKKHKKKPPRGMYLTQEDLLALATGPVGQGEALLKQLDAELVQLKRQVQNNKQLISMHKQKAHGGIDKHRLPTPPQKIVPKWTNEELSLAVHGIRTYGKDFYAVAEVLENKTESHIRNFFVNYRRRYNLDEVLSHYEKENGIVPEKKRKIENGSSGTSEAINGEGDKLEKMEVEDDISDENQVPITVSNETISISNEKAEAKDAVNTINNSSPLVTKQSPPSPNIQPAVPLISNNKTVQPLKSNTTSPANSKSESKPAQVATENSKPT